MSHPRALSLLAPIAAALALALSGCTVNHPGAATTSDGGITVRASDTACTLSTAATKSGNATFTITNSGSQTTEFELLAKDGLTIVAEVENIAPGLTRTLTLQTQPGTYTSLCKPGMTGDGVGKASFQVTGAASTESGSAKTLADAAAARYVAYVRDQTATLLAKTKQFAALVTAGEDAQAKALYPTARAYYERVEPIAESFGDLDPELDARQADIGAGQTWTGWHRIEKDLWPPSTAANGGSAYVKLTSSARAELTDLLVADTEQLFDKVEAASFSVAAGAISNGAIGLLDEVAKSKITGEEEIWSHTDLWDFKANVQGAEVAYAGVRDIAKRSDAALATTLDARFAALDALLAKYGSLEKGYVSYGTLTQADVKALSDSVNALAAPLSQLTATVLK